MATIRELTARLGLEFDGTAAARFDAAIDRSKLKAESLNKINLLPFVALFKVAGAAAAAVFAVSFGGALKFAEVLQVEAAVKNLAKDNFLPLKKEIQDILADPLIGKLTTELDLLNAAFGSLKTGLDPGVVIRTLRPALEFAALTRQSVSDVTSAVSSFIADANTDLLVQLGVFNQAQLELFKAAGIGPGQQGIIARTAFLEDVFADLAPGIRKQLGALGETGALSFQELANTFSELTKEIGERTLPGFKAFNDELIKILDRIRSFVRGEIEGEEVVRTPEKEAVAEVIEQTVSNPVIREILKFITGFETGKKFLPVFFDPEGVTQRLGEVTKSRAPGISGNNAGTTNNQSNVTITVPVTIESGATGDATMIGRKVEEGIRKVMGTAVDQSKRTTIIRGSN